MYHKQVALLRCPICHSDISEIYTITQSTRIFSCSCNQYPMILGILYLKSDNVQKKAIDLLYKKKVNQATFVLLSVNKKILFCLYLLFFSPLKRYIKGFGFNTTMHMLQFFSYDKNWVSYLTKRHRLPTFFFSYVANTVVTQRGGFIVDVGCGLGQTLPNLCTKILPTKVIGIDQSFLSLFLARKLFADERILLVCTNIEKGFPLKSLSIQSLLAADTFHSVNNKQNFLHEAYRVTDKEKSFACIHTVQHNMSGLSTLRPISPKNVLKMCKEVGFANTYLVDEESFWISLTETNGEVVQTPLHSNAKDYIDYSFFTSQSKFKTSLFLTPTEKKELMDTPVLYKDKHLEYAKRLYALCSSNDSICILSPHLDDAVLSCERLIRLFKRLKKAVHVITVFTEASDSPYSLQAIDLLSVCGYTDAIKFFRDRKKEDILAMKAMGVEYTHFQFIDAAWRKKGQHPKKFIYSSASQQFSGYPVNEDRKLEKEIYNSIKSLNMWDTVDCVIAPLSIGGHVDHVIVNSVANKLGKNVLFYWEFPYSTDKIKVDAFLECNPRYSLLFSVEKEYYPSLWKSTKSLYHTFYSQEQLLSDGQGLPLVSEQYYSLEKQ
jgi:ubiquinone/menaquinone biosynthesis C-methylase UbiE